MPIWRWFHPFSEKPAGQCPSHVCAAQGPPTSVPLCMLLHFWFPPLDNKLLVGGDIPLSSPVFSGTWSGVGPLYAHWLVADRPQCEQSARVTGDSGEDIDAWKERVTAQGEQALWPYHLLVGLLFWLLNLRCADYSMNVLTSHLHHGRDTWRGRKASAICPDSSLGWIFRQIFVFWITRQAVSWDLT